MCLVVQKLQLVLLRVFLSTDLFAVKVEQVLQMMPMSIVAVVTLAIIGFTVFGAEATVPSPIVIGEYGVATMHVSAVWCNVR